MQIERIMAFIRAAMLILVAICFLVDCNRIKILELQESELENQLERLNKPTIKTIQTIYGDKYNCVDFYQQPGFDHPAFKNCSHDLQLKLHSCVKKLRKNNEDTPNRPRLPNIWLNDEGCPPDTVPIKQTTKDDLLRSKIASEMYSSNQGTVMAKGVHYAILRSKDESRKYKGASMTASLWTPKVLPSEYSSSQMKIRNGQDIIQIGWTVNPSLYKDNRTRFFMHADTASMHCFNTNCHGFVVTYPDIPLDYAFESTSTCGGPTYITEFHIRQGFDIGTWEIQLSNDTVLGFFAPGVFKEMEEFGTYVEWGGQVYSPPNTALPQMGSGHKRPSYWEWDGNYDAYCICIRVLNQNGQLEDASSSMEPYADMYKIYQVEDGGFRNDTGRLLFFGGMGKIPTDNPCQY